MDRDPIVLVAGDRRPLLEIEVRRKGQVVDLSDTTTVHARIERPGLEPLERPLLIDPDPATGIARLAWEAGDLALVDGADRANYLLEIVLDKDLGTQETAPDPVKLTVRRNLPAPA